jgi:hypothetical protein
LPPAFSFASASAAAAAAAAAATASDTHSGAHRASHTRTARTLARAVTARVNDRTGRWRRSLAKQAWMHGRLLHHCVREHIQHDIARWREAVSCTATHHGHLSTVQWQTHATPHGKRAGSRPRNTVTCSHTRCGLLQRRGLPRRVVERRQRRSRSDGRRRGTLLHPDAQPTPTRSGFSP